MHRKTTDLPVQHLPSPPGNPVVMKTDGCCVIAIERDLLVSLVTGAGLSSEFKLSSHQTPRCTPPSLFYMMMKLGPGKGKVFMSLALCSQTPAMKQISG